MHLLLLMRCYRATGDVRDRMANAVNAAATVIPAKPNAVKFTAGKLIGTRLNAWALSSIRCQEMWTAIAAAMITATRGALETRNKHFTAMTSNASSVI